MAAADVGPGMRVLDVGAGSGYATLPAAETGATVVACDPTPELLAAGERHARERGLAVRWEVADAQALPFADGEFDVVLSCIGAVFAPDQAAAARELLRVCRPGGTVAMANWDPDRRDRAVLRPGRPLRRAFARRRRADAAGVGRSGARHRAAARCGRADRAPACDASGSPVRPTRSPSTTCGTSRRSSRRSPTSTTSGRTDLRVTSRRSSPTRTPARPTGPRTTRTSTCWSRRGKPR